MFDLSDKVVIVTGASQGIGRTMATVFAESGANVVCVARSEKKIEELSMEIKSQGGLAIPAVCDISDGDSFSRTIKSVVDQFGKLDVLVNNAGITRDALLMRMNESRWDEVIQTNLKGAFFGMKAAIRPMMKNKFGRIISISSVVGFTGNPGQANYCASKSGIIGFTKSLALEVASRGITVNAIAPGFISSAMTDKLTEDQREKIISNIPVNRLGTPKDVANAVIFLAKEDSSYITGNTIHINGGLAMV